MKLSITGAIFLIVAWGSVTLLTVYCFAKVLRPKHKPGTEDDDSHSR